METFLLLFCVFFCILWIGWQAYVIFAIVLAPKFEKLSAPGLETWPKLSVIIPACNEEAHIKSAATTVLAQDYPNIEVILINDRSTDSTGPIIESLAAKDTRIRTVHIDHLPDKWLGKVHALYQGVNVATGDWFLFTDADVHYSHGTLKHAIAVAEHNTLDHLTLFPSIRLKSFALKLAVLAFGGLLLTGARTLSVNSIKSRKAIGIGAFNLVRASAYYKTQGFSWLSLEPADDPGLAIMLKDSGAKSYFAFGFHHLYLDWYPDIKSMFRGVEKNLYGPTAQYSLLKLFSMVLMMWIMAMAPLLSAIIGIMLSSKLLLILSSIALVIHLVYTSINIDRQKLFISRFFMPGGIILVGLMMIWAAYKCVSTGGIDWRGTHYPLNQLRGNQRVKF